MSYIFYENDVFDFSKWSANSVHTVEEANSCLMSFTLLGEKIKKMKTVGECTNYRSERVEDLAYHTHELLYFSEEEKEKRSDYFNIDENTEYPRCVEIDEPFMIEFESGNSFEIDFAMTNTIYMNTNSIPWRVQSKYAPSNVDIDILFSPCIGATINSFEVIQYEHDSNLVESIILWLEDSCGIRFRGIKFSVYNFSYWIVELVDCNNKGYNSIKMKDLRPALYNYKDLHTDLETGYTAKSPAVFFGEKGADMISEIYITLFSESKMSFMCIAHDICKWDFLLFSWAITLKTKEYFDEYQNYEFSKSDWNDILTYAEKLLSFNTFDELFDYFTGFDIIDEANESNITLYLINDLGEEFWNNRGHYRTIFNDVRTWSVLVLNNSDKIYIEGF